MKRMTCDECKSVSMRCFNAGSTVPPPLRARHPTLDEKYLVALKVLIE